MVRGLRRMWARWRKERILEVLIAVFRRHGECTLTHLFQNYSPALPVILLGSVPRDEEPSYRPPREC